MPKQEITLNNICNGKLEEAFQEVYPAIVSQLTEGTKGTIAINITIERVQNTVTMVNTSFSLTPKFPAKKKSNIAEIMADGKLKTEVIPPTANLFDINNLRKEAAVTGQEGE